jgi:GNAT superfamily N-acetyltransferase
MENGIIDLLRYQRKGKGKYRMNIVKIIDSNKTKYMELLLIADEQVSMIEKYLYRGDMFALCDDDVKAICIVTQEQSGVYEIKNIVTVPEYQRKGYGQHLISYIIDYYKKSGKELYVGTGDSPMTLHFYEKCGFEKSHIVKNFFIDNYDHPMYEDGKQLVDMIYLKRPL